MGEEKNLYNMSKEELIGLIQELNDEKLRLSEKIREMEKESGKLMLNIQVYSDALEQARSNEQDHILYTRKLLDIMLNYSKK